VLVEVLAQARMVGLVEQREVDLREIGNTNVEGSIGPGACDEPLGYG